jgi:hypothetical protein
VLRYPDESVAPDHVFANWTVCWVEANVLPHGPPSGRRRISDLWASPLRHMNNLTHWYKASGIPTGAGDAACLVSRRHSPDHKFITHPLHGTNLPQSLSADQRPNFAPMLLWLLEAAPNPPRQKI